MFYSPLRYPGGKKRLAKFIAQICLDNNINGHYIEPYSGGSAVALYLLIEQKVKRITINDYDRSIYAFWYCVLNKTNWLCDKIKNTKITVDEWSKQKDIQKNKNVASLQDLGFSTLFLNRTNRSGIINAGIIGGYKQGGKYKIGCRFNKESIIKKINIIANHKANITLHNLDCLKLIQKIRKTKNTIFYFDPPYYVKGACLYANSYSKDDHEVLSQEIKKIKNASWLISYDNEIDIQSFYDWVIKKHEYFLSHFSGKLKKGKEVIFFSEGLNFKKALKQIN